MVWVIATLTQIAEQRNKIIRARKTPGPERVSSHWNCNNKIQRHRNAILTFGAQINNAPRGSRGCHHLVGPRRTSTVCPIPSRSPFCGRRYRCYFFLGCIAISKRGRQIFAGFATHLNGRKFSFFHGGRLARETMRGRGRGWQFCAMGYHVL